MNKTKTIGTWLLIIGLVALPFSLVALENNGNTSSFVKDLYFKISKAIQNMEEVPDISAEEFVAFKKEVLRTWNNVARSGVFEITGADEDVRPYFVTLQGIIEQVLSMELQNEVKSLKGIIHTPMPATPLCSLGEISKGLVDQTIEHDPQRLFTVKARTTIVRDFLSRGGFLYVAYPKEGMSKRTYAQQSIYKQELINYPDNLLDRPLKSPVPDELIGATYLFTDKTDQPFAFAIKMTQAKDPKRIGHFGLWFDSLQNEAVKKRVSAVSNFVKTNCSKPFDLDS